MAYRPYLFFGGNCRSAFTRYHEIFGGELNVMTLRDAPGPEEAPPELADMVMHASLVVGDDVLMGSDDPTAEDFGPVQGMVVSYDAVDDAEAHRVFDALADGGSVTQTLEPTFFSTAFGMCIDRFGTPWMVVGPEPAQTS